jgi:hypothetical protein
MIRYVNIALLSLFLIIPTGCERELSSSYSYGPEQSITLIKPAGGEIYTNDEIVIISWLSRNLDGKLRIELIREGESVYAVNSIPDSGNYILRIPGELIPSKKYQLRIESMTNPEVSDITAIYFEIAPLIDGNWYYSNIEELSGLEIRLQLAGLLANAFLGNGYFHLRYFSAGNVINYQSADTVGGTISYPTVNFKMRNRDSRELKFSGEMVTGGRIEGKISGYIDSVYGSIDDSIKLVRQ